MYCVKCGHPADEGNEYCANCGAELQKPVMIPDDEESDRNVTPSKNAAAKRLKLMLVIGAGIVVLTALVLLFLSFGTIKDWFYRSTSSPENLLRMACQDALSTSFSPVMENYEKVLTIGKNADVKSQAEITLKNSDQILDMISDAVYAGQTDMSWLSEIRLNVDFSIRDNLQENILAVGLGEQRILSAELITDSLNQKMYLTLPELNQQSLISDMEQNTGVTNLDMAKLYEAMPSRQVLEQLAVRYMEILLGGFSNVEKYSETLTLNSMSQDVTVLEAYIDHIDLLDVLVTVLEQVKADEDIKQIAEGLNPWYNDLMERSTASYNDYFSAGYEPVDLYEELIAAVDEYLEQLEDAFKTADSENHLYLYVYLNKSNEIIGTKLLISGMEGSISNLTLSEGSEYTKQILIGNLEVDGSGHVSDALSGSFTVSVEGEKLLDIEAENLTKSKGTVYLEPSAALLQMLANDMGLDGAMVSMADVVLCVRFEETDSDSWSAVSVLSNEVPVLELTISGKMTHSAEILLPKSAVQSDNEETLNHWLADCDLGKLYSNLSDAGVPEELLTVWLWDDAE